MIPPLTLAALLAESCRLHARLLKSFFENHLLIGAAGLALLGLMRWMDLAGKADAWAMLPLAACLAVSASIALAMLFPAVRNRARQAWINEQRAAFLLRNSELVASLSPSSRQRYNAMHSLVSRLGDLSPGPRSAVIAPGEHLLWLHLKLLIARDHLNDSAALSSPDALAAERDTIAADLANPSLTHAARTARQHSLDLLDQRLSTARMRLGRLDEIEADTVRIEHQIALICERAAQHSSLGDAGVHVELAISPTDAFADDLPGGSLINEQETFFRRCSLE